MICEKKRKLKQDDDAITLHMCFTGPPGTGKTTVARIVSRLLFKYGLLSKDKLKEVTRSDLVSGFSGQSVHKTRAVIEEALGGVLFIDEAYSLSEASIQGSGQDYGAEVINEIISSMENFRDKLCIIFAGYSDEMDRFLNLNPGMKSRTARIIEFPDYSEGELWDILIHMVSVQRMSCDQSIKSDFETYMRKLKSSHVAGKFGNAREVRNSLERAKLSLARRMKAIDAPSVKQISTLISNDFDFMFLHKADYEPMLDLNKLIGLKTVKKEMQDLKDWAMMVEKRKKQGIEIIDSRTMHMCFTGPPGTGKTTVARIVGQILFKSGLLASNKFREVTRSDLVAGFIGQSVQKARKLIEEGLGGVLFVDEAYSLSEASIKGSSQDYGAEVINEFISSMENYRDRLCIIFAGYSEEMDRFLKLNPGMKSRIARIIEFPDYSEDELWDIFNHMVSKHNMSCDQTIQPGFKAHIRHIIASQESGRFGNAREVRNIFERSELMLASRIKSIDNPGREELTSLQACDFEFLS